MNFSLFFREILFVKFRFITESILIFRNIFRFNSREMIQQLNIIFNRIFTVLRFKMHNRNFYDPAG